MTITRDDLNKIYLEEEKKQKAIYIEDFIVNFKNSVFETAKKGTTEYHKSFNLQNEPILKKNTNEIINEILQRLKNIFADSKVNIKEHEIHYVKHFKIDVNWGRSLDV